MRSGRYDFVNIQQLSNPQYWASLFSNPWNIIVNLIDIAIVAWLLYYFIKVIAGTKIMILVRGVLTFILIKLIANMIGLTTISCLINQISPEERLVQSYVKAVAYMSPRKIGALVAIQGSRTLQEYISTGIPLDANVSGELLINIFIPNTPLHDGAVIVTNDKIAVSCAYLPLTESTGISKEFGTRHRAAIGLSEVTDAFTFVVSEETGGISITRNGTFKHDLSLEEFEQELRSFIIPEDQGKKDLKSRIFGGRFK